MTSKSLSVYDVCLAGVTYHKSGKLRDAERLYRAILQVQPTNPDANHNLGVLAMQVDKPALSLSFFKTALESNPSIEQFWISYVEGLLASGNVGDARNILRQGMAKGLRGEAADRLVRRISESGVDMISPKQILSKQHVVTDTHVADFLGPFWRHGTAEENEKNHRMLLEIDPDRVDAHINLGSILFEKSRFEEALVHFDRAVKIKPDCVEAYIGSGIALGELGRVHEAVVRCDQVLSITPDHHLAWSNKLFFQMHCHDVSPRRKFRQHRLFGQRLEARLPVPASRLENDPDPGRTLRVGFVSGDFRNHSAAFFMAPLLRNLHAGPYALFAYSNTPAHDAVTAQLKQYLHFWRDLSGFDDEAAETIIRRDRIDILIDLSGHTALNRLPLFARKPAPVQASCLGYPGTTGLRAMDYYFVDRRVAPPGLLDDQFTEKLVRLPVACLYAPPSNAPAASSLPALRTGTFTFGSFNRASKLNAPVLDLWSRILTGAPRSRLLFGAIPAGDCQDRIIARMARNGVAPERLSFAPRLPLEDYWRLHEQVDLLLDPFPYNGGTTTLHALWMGVPAVSLAGRTLVGRVGGAILGHLGLPEFSANTRKRYVQVAIRWSRRQRELERIRLGLRQRLAHFLAKASDGFARDLDQALRRMWRRWRQGLPPKSFEARP